jgi:hypothetical protein
MFFKVQLLKKPENVSQILPQRSGKILHYLKLLSVWTPTCAL